jgi:antitoxin MazE
MQTKIARWGNSLALRLPKALGEEAGFTEGQEVELRAEDGRIVVMPAAQPHVYKLDDLVGEMRRLGLQSAPAAEDWSPAGREWPEEDWSDLAPSAEEVKHARQRRTSRRG